MDIARNWINKLRPKRHTNRHYRSHSDIGPLPRSDSESYCSRLRSNTHANIADRRSNESNDFKTRRDRQATPPLSLSSDSQSINTESTTPGVPLDRPHTWSMADALRTRSGLQRFSGAWNNTSEMIHEDQSGLRNNDNDNEHSLISPIRFISIWSNADRPGRRPRRPPTKSTFFYNERWERKKHFRQLDEVTPAAVERELFRRLSRYESVA